MNDSAGSKIKRVLRLERALALVWRAAAGWTTASAVLVLLQAGLPLVQLYLMKLTVDAVTAGIAAPDKQVFVERVIWLVTFTGAAALAGVVLASAAKVVGQAQGQEVTDHVQDVLHAKSVALDLEYYENAAFYDALHRAQQEAPYRPTRIVNGLVNVAQNGITLVGIAALLLSCHWGIAVVLFAAMIPGVFLRLKYAGRMYRWQRDRSATERRASYLNWLLTSEIHAKEVRLFDLGKLFVGRFRDLRRLLRREKIGFAFKQALSEFVTQAGATIAIFASFGYIAYRTLQGAMTLGDLVMYYQAFQRGQGYLRELLSGLAGLYEDNLFLTNFYEFLDLKPRVLEPRTSVNVPRPMKQGIAFEKVGFHYPGCKDPVLADISLTVPPGEVVALVGENGSGKTTLVKLLCRLYDPTEGRILIDGIDLRRFRTTALRREIGIIFQDYTHYQMTARENIWMGNVQLPPDHEKIITAARYSGADEIFKGLPRGYETMLGKQFENGTELSIGQWQKVALARAFLRDAQVLVLDEPTSAMDPKAEYEVFSSFRQQLQGRSAILISHRFSTVRMADRIYVLDRGSIIESGGHEDLLKSQGTYAQLFEMQARNYR